MVMMHSSLPDINHFLKPIALRVPARQMVIRMIVAFTMHSGRMAACRAATAVRTNCCHRAQVARSLGRKFWDKKEVLGTLQRAALAGKAARGGRFLLLLDQTHVSQQGKKAQNTYHTGNRSRRPRKGRRYSKYRHAQKTCHCFVMGLLLTPDGMRIPFNKCFYTRAHCQTLGVKFRTQTELAAEILRELPLPEGADVVVLGDTAFDAVAIREACAARGFIWIVPINPERVLAGDKPRPKVKSLVSDFSHKQFRAIRLQLEGPLAVYRRVSRCRLGSKQKHRTFYVHQERRDVHSVGPVQLVFSTRTQPTAEKLDADKILMTNGLKLETRTIVELYDLRWQIELFFKELKSTLGFDQYQHAEFRRVERWAEMALTTFLYAERHRDRERRRRDLPKKTRDWWTRQRTYGICQAIRQATERQELEYLKTSLRTPGGIRRLKRQLEDSYQPEYRVSI